MSDQEINLIAAAALLALIVLAAWGLRRISAQDRADREALDRRARASKVESVNSAFNAGTEAALDGQEFWTNPHCSPSGIKDKSQAWAAGWCYGRQLLRDARRADD